MSDLSSRIMNIQARHEKIMAVKDELTGFEEFDTIVRVAYKMGHRDARHEAAEMAESTRQPSPALSVAVEALEIAKSFCDSLTAEVCPDSVAIPITDALAKIKGEVGGVKVENGLLVNAGGPKYCSFRSDVKCGVHCLHFKIRDRHILSDEVPTGKKFFGWELTSLGWINDGREAVLRCGAEAVIIKLESTDEN